jgi:hypothetical protein
MWEDVGQGACKSVVRKHISVLAQYERSCLSCAGLWGLPRRVADCGWDCRLCSCLWCSIMGLAEWSPLSPVCHPRRRAPHHHLQGKDFRRSSMSCYSVAAPGISFCSIQASKSSLSTSLSSLSLTNLRLLKVLPPAVSTFASRWVVYVRC